MGSGYRLCVMRDAYWVCRCVDAGKQSAKPARGTLALILDLTGSVTIVSGGRVGECVGPYRAIASDILDPGLVGFMARVAGALAKAGIPLMAYSSFERDYILVPAKYLEKAVTSLKEAGFDVKGSCEELT